VRDDDELAREAWRNSRSGYSSLVAVLTADNSCPGALWAQDPGASVPRRGKLEPRKFKDALESQFMAPDGPYGTLWELYQLDDLNGEYGDAGVNEKKLPPASRLNPAAIKHNWRSFSACDGDACVAVYASGYWRRELARGAVIDRGTVHGPFSTCGTHPDVPLAAVDLDGDGAVELVFATKAGIAFFGRHQSGAAELRQQPCWFVTGD
jgi:hypothetical protein